MSFKDLGVNEALCDAIQRIKWTTPTEIQKKAIPFALQGKDIVGLAKTGSGKTGAFTIPIIQALMENTHSFFALILTPTRELATQIQNEFYGLGKGIGVKCVTLIGGLCEKTQSEQLLKNPHIIIATPGRFLKHITTTKGFNEQTLKNLKFLVMDEADRMLSSQFEHDLTKILYVLPRTRTTYLFSATNTDKVHKLQRASLRNPVSVIVDEKYADSDKLKEYLLVVPYETQCAYLVWLLRQLTGPATPTPLDIAGLRYLDADDSQQKKKSKSVIVFVQTKIQSNILALFLKMLGLRALPINSDMSQEQRAATIAKMKMQKIDIMIATDVAARGIDIPNVDVVIHYDLPENAKTYTHRTGRTGRADKRGVAIVLVNQYFAMKWVAIEDALKRKLEPLFDFEECADEVAADLDNVKQCYREAELGLKQAMAGRCKRRAFNLTDSLKKIDKKRKLAAPQDQ